MTITTRRKAPTRLDNLTIVPPLSVEILVYWATDSGDLEWWKADVTKVNAVKKRSVVGVGTILYETKKDHDDYVADVEFLFTKKHGRLVREVGAKAIECAWRMEGDSLTTTNDTTLEDNAVEVIESTSGNEGDTINSNPNGSTKRKDNTNDDDDSGVQVKRANLLTKLTS